MLKTLPWQMIARGCSLGVLAGLLVVAFESSDFQGEICEYNQATKHEDCTTYSLFPFLFIQVCKTLNDYGVAITGIATVFLAIITGWLVFVARDQSNTTRAQLRAYVYVSPLGLRNIIPTQNVHFTFATLNGGQTPAYSVTQTGDLLFLVHPLPENFPFPKLPMKRASKTMIAPHTPFTGNMLATQRFTKDEIIEILEGKATGGKRLYIFGQIDYIDAFKKPHWTRFCFSFSGWLTAVALARRDQWDEITRILDQGLALNVEIAPQHNFTDDG